jgi:hypothetical protein
LSDRITVDPQKQLDEYSPSERRAILVHRYFLGIEYRREPSIQETIASWEARFARNWRRTKVMKDLSAQLREIERHKFFLSEKAGYDIGWESAAKDWIQAHAGAWRDWWERQDLSNP